jgi:hypothetical protein
VVVALHFARRHRGLWSLVPLEAPYSDHAATEAAATAVYPTVKSPRVTLAMLTTRIRQYFDELAGNLSRRQKAHRDSVKDLKAQLERMREQQQEFVKVQLSTHRAIEAGAAKPARAAAAVPPPKVAVRRAQQPPSSDSESSSAESCESDATPPPRRRARGRPAAAAAAVTRPLAERIADVALARGRANPPTRRRTSRGK